MRDVIRIFLIMGILAVLGASAVIFGGLYNVSARQGHLPGVSWILHTTFRNAAELRAPPSSSVPAFTDDMISLGAKHFDTGCRPCHGAPGEERTAAARAMVPPPPHIKDAVGSWTPAELFWIVREGVKMTGMPAFPAARDDEVWSVVAFLERVRAMDGDQYAAFTSHPKAGPQVAYCASCHGVDGRSENTLVPRLDILSGEYIASALSAYRDGRRHSGIMQQAASRISQEGVQHLSAHYGEQSAVDTGIALRGAQNAGAGGTLAGTGTDDIPACRACHGPDAEQSNPLFPSLAGQSHRYLEMQLRLWRDGYGTNGGAADLMQKAARELDDEDIAALAAYYSAHPVDRTPSR